MRTDWDLLSEALADRFGAGEPVWLKGRNRYGTGWSIPTTDRGRLEVFSRGAQEHPAVTVSGWPTDEVVTFLRANWEGQASRVDAAVDFAGDIAPWAEVVVRCAQLAGMKWGTYHQGPVPTGVQAGAGSSESRTRVYDAALAHPGEFSGPTGRLEHEWKPGSKDRKEAAYVMTAEAVLGTSRLARVAVMERAGVDLPQAPARTERVSDLDRWVVWLKDTQGARLVELLERLGGDRELFAAALLDWKPDRRAVSRETLAAQGIPRQSPADRQPVQRL